MDDFDEEGIVQLRKEKGRELKNLQGRIRKLKKEIAKGEFEGLIIDRSEYQQEIDTKSINWLGNFRRKNALGGEFLS